MGPEVADKNFQQGTLGAGCILKFLVRRTVCTWRMVAPRRKFFFANKAKASSG